MKSLEIRIKWALVLLLIFVFAIPAFPDKKADQVDALFAQWDKPGSPGCALGVIRDGKFIYKRGYGMANLEYNVPITSTSIFRIGSTSKQFSAMCIASLEEEGKLSVDDNIRKYLPEIPDYGTPITIRHLILHISGLRDYLTLMFLSGARDDDFYTDPEVVDLLSRQKELNFPPGEEYLYSNSGYFLLSLIVKRVSGKSLREYAQEHVFTPLKMTHTHFHDDHTEIVENRAFGYSPKKEDGFRIDMTTLDMIGDGGVFTCVDDLFLWDQNFYHNILGKGGQDLIERVLTPGKLNSGKTMDYASGLRVSRYRGLKLVSHGGAFVGYRAEMVRFPEVRFSVIILANLSSINPSRLALQVADIYLDGEYKEEKPSVPARPEFITLPASELEMKTGSYYSQANDRFWRVSLKEGKLWVDTSAGGFFIIPVSPERFLAVDAPVDLEVVFEKQPGGKPLRMLRIIEGEDPVVFEATRFVTPTPDQLAGYTGRYFSSELQVAYTVVLEDGKLYLRHENLHKDYPHEPLEPTFVDRFLVSGLQIKFFRGSQNEVLACTIDAGRVKNIRFEKQ